MKKKNGMGNASQARKYQAAHFFLVLLRPSRGDILGWTTLLYRKVNRCFTLGAPQVNLSTTPPPPEYTLSLSSIWPTPQAHLLMTSVPPHPPHTHLSYPPARLPALGNTPLWQVPVPRRKCRVPTSLGRLSSGAQTGAGGDTAGIGTVGSGTARKKASSSDATVFSRLRREAEGCSSSRAVVASGDGDSGGGGGGGQSPAVVVLPPCDSFADLVRKKKRAENVTDWAANQ